MQELPGKAVYKCAGCPLKSQDALNTDWKLDGNSALQLVGTRVPVLRQTEAIKITFVTKQPSGVNLLALSVECPSEQVKVKLNP